MGWVDRWVGLGQSADGSHKMDLWTTGLVCCIATVYCFKSSLQFYGQT